MPPDHPRQIARIMSTEPDRDWSRVVFIVRSIRRRVWWPDRRAWPWPCRRVVVGYAYLYGEAEVTVEVSL